MKTAELPNALGEEAGVHACSRTGTSTLVGAEATQSLKQAPSGSARPLGSLSSAHADVQGVSRLPQGSLYAN